jgi:hypothetical protein
MNVQQELRLVAGLGSLSTTWSPEHQVFRDTNDLASAHNVMAKRGKVYTEFEKYRNPELLLRSITSIPGSLHPETRAGEIQRGFRASLLVLNPDHPAIWPAVDPLRAIAYCDVAPTIQAMMVGGKWIVSPTRDFRSTLLESKAYRDAIKEAQDRRSKLFDTITS